MATTTTNFGFDVPTSSDLVKNGATQIALLGQDIDTFLAGSPTYTAGKNLIMNGNMNISQRGTSFAAVVNDYTMDRWNARNNLVGVFTVSQDTDAPAGFKTSAKFLCTTADASLAANDFIFFRQQFEGQALQALQKGTATAKTTTLSFWVKANLTGNYVARLSDGTNTRSIAAIYTINAASTWEKKTISFAGDTSGLLNNDNAGSISLEFWLGAGSDRTSGTLNTTWAASVNANTAVGQTNLAATLNNFWSITGVQWEIGSTATPFQTATGTIQGELAACQRYYWRANTIATVAAVFGYGSASSTTVEFAYMNFPVEMRVKPTALDNPTVGTNFTLIDGASNSYALTALTFDSNQTSTTTGTLTATVASGLTQFRPYAVRGSTTAAYIGWSAEL